MLVQRIKRAAGPPVDACLQADFRTALHGPVVHNLRDGTCNCDSFMKASTFPQIFFSKPLTEKLYFRLIKVSPSRARAHNSGLFVGLRKRSCTDLSTEFVDKRKTPVLLNS
jgi:hypothetical protein